MPELDRDLALIEEFHNKIKEIRTAAKEYAEENAEYIAQFPEPMRRLIPHLGFGQAISEQAYAAYEEKTGHSLTEGQHPHEAVISASHFSGNPTHILGNEGVEDIGRALSMRNLSTYVSHKDTEPRYETVTFVSLAAELKGIPTLYHAKTAASEILVCAYYYHQYNVKPRLLETFFHDDQETLAFINDPNVLAILKDKKDIFDEVLGNGFKHYEKMLVVDAEDSNRVLAATEGLERGYRETDDERFIRSLTIAQLLKDRVSLMNCPHAPDNVVSIYQSIVSKREYVWNAEKNKFIVIPEKDEDSPNLPAERERFLANMPKNGKWPAICETLMRGAREYRKTMALRSVAEELTSVLRAYIVSCSDSRAQTIAIMGPRADNLRYNLRNPGGMVSRLGEMTSDGARLYAIARKNGKAVILTPHSTCGAMTAIDAYLSKQGEALPEPFKLLGQHRRHLYDTVRNRGVTPEQVKAGAKVPPQGYTDQEIIKHYSTIYGVPLTSVADCLSIQQSLDDYTTATQAYPDVLSVVVFQNMSECKNYLLNPKSMRFEPIPSGCAFLPGPTRGCNCGCSHPGGGKKKPIKAPGH